MYNTPSFGGIQQTQPIETYDWDRAKAQKKREDLVVSGKYTPEEFFSIIKEKGLRVEGLDEVKAKVAKLNYEDPYGMYKPVASSESGNGSLGLAKTIGYSIGAIPAIKQGVKLAKEKINQSKDIPEINQYSNRATQKVKNKVVKDILNVPTNYYTDDNEITKTFLKYAEPTDNLEDLKTQFNTIKKTVIGERNDLISNYAREHEKASVIKNLEEHIDSLSTNPHAKSEVKKLKEMLDTEKDWLSSQKTLTTELVEKRKEQLNNQLKKFFDKDPALLTETEKIKQQGLNSLRKGYAEEINNLVLDPTNPDYEKIKKLNKEYGELSDIETLLNKRLNQTRKVLPSTSMTRKLADVGEGVGATPGISVARRFFPQLSNNERVLGRLESTLKGIKDFAETEGFRKTANFTSKAFKKLFKPLATLGTIIGVGELATISSASNMKKSELEQARQTVEEQIKKANLEAELTEGQRSRVEDVLHSVVVSKNKSLIDKTKKMLESRYDLEMTFGRKLPQVLDKIGDYIEAQPDFKEQVQDYLSND